MEYFLTPFSPPHTPWAYWENGFNDSELDIIEQQALQHNNFRATTRGLTDSDEALKKIRRSFIKWINCDNENLWIFERLSNIVSTLNVQYFNLSLTGFGEPIQLTTYDQSENGMYSWHQDFGNTISRKMSIVMQLTDPSKYEGGNLQIQVGGETQTVKKQRGFIAAFPSYQLHQVTPVTKGIRCSLVAWISGPPFK